jgi:tetratricopeptide (TPR) repeat protein
MNSIASTKPPLKISTKKEKIFTEAYTFFKLGSYQEVIAHLDQADQAIAMTKMGLYLKGITYNKMQQFNLAVKSFKKAAGHQQLPNDLWYEYGQALYALKDYKKARAAFVKSAQNNFKKDTSLFYIGYCSLELKDYKRAYRYFKKLEDEFPDGNEVKQSGSYQIGEILFLQAKNRPHLKKIVASEILPQFQKSLLIAENSTLSGTIRQRVNDLTQQFGLGPKVMANGRRLPASPWILRLGQDLNYDDNVTNEADEAQIRASNKDSYFTNSNVRASYLYPFNDVFTTRPQINANLIHYFENENPEVYENNAHDYTLNNQITLDHFLFEKTATFKIDYDFTKRFTDFDADKEKEELATDKKLSLTEDFKLFPIGNTSFSFKRKTTKSYDPASNSETDTFAINQTFLLPHSQILILTTNFDDTDNATINNSTGSSLYRLDYLFPDFYQGLRGQVSFGVTFLDTKRQSESRGTEVSYNPSLEFGKTFFKKLSATVKYGYTKKISKDKTTYAYTKNDYGLSLEYLY